MTEAEIARRLTAADLLAALIKGAKGLIAVPELRLGTGYGRAVEQRIDLWTIDPAPSKGWRAVACEIKVSRSDFKRDSAFKQRGARLFSDQFFYVAPPKIITKDEVPDWAGLIEFDWHQDSWSPTPYLRKKIVVDAPVRGKDAPGWGMVCSILRRTPIDAPEAPQAVAAELAKQEGGE